MTRTVSKGLRSIMPTPRDQEEQQLKEFFQHWHKLSTLPFGRSPEVSARAEGWLISDCIGSEFGRWQIQRVDEANEGDFQLSHDDEAWAKIFTGRQRHHIEARAFIKRHNPREWERWCAYAPSLKKFGLRMEDLADDLKAEIVAAVLAD